jgi:putative monooxygenase
MMSKATSQKPVVLRPSGIPARQRGGGAKTIPLVTRRTGSTSFINGITC